MNPELQNLLQMAMQTTSPVSTQVLPQYAHDSIDTEIDKDNQFTMSQMPERQLVGTGLGLLDMITGPAKAASLVTAGTPKFMKIIKDFKLSTEFDPDTKRKMVNLYRKLRDTSPKYKDAPERELMDRVIKIDDLMQSRSLARGGPTKMKSVQEAKYTVDKNLLRAMREIEKTGMEGTIVSGTEANIKNTFRTLMELMR